MDDSGMTDLQFKCLWRKLIRALEDAERQDTLEKMRMKVEGLRKQLQADMQD